MLINFSHQAVRDLAWVISSAGMLRANETDRVSDHWCRVAYLDRIPWLRHLDNEPTELEAWLDSHQDKRLGHYFETLIAFWLQQWPRTELLAYRLPVKDESRTLGEFDFIFYDREQGRTCHWECAVKFFLRWSEEQGYRWLGPNPRDTLVDKFNKLFSRQLRLSSLPAAQAQLRKRVIEPPLAQAFFKGYLFYPAAGDWQHPQPLPEQSSAAHLRGWWCYADALEELPEHGKQCRWVALPRLQWLSPVFGRETLPGYDREGVEAMLAEHFRASGKPILLAAIGRGDDSSWRELSRGFVVPTHWPQLKRQSGTIRDHD